MSAGNSYKLSKRISSVHLKLRFYIALESPLNSSSQFERFILARTSITLCNEARIVVPKQMSNYETPGNRSIGVTRTSSISRKMRRSITRVKRSIQRMTTEDYQTDDEQILRIAPERLSSLSDRTGFSKEEIRKMYRDFKQHCPGGAATTSDLKPAYAKLFPLGDSSKYAQIVFNRLDSDKDGIVSFSDLIAGLTCIVKGNTDQKLTWIFGLYDINGDGLITRGEMLLIVSSIYEMIQSNQSIKSAVNKHVEKLFEKMDLNRDGVISKEEFFTSCKNDTLVREQLNIFDNCFWR